MAWKRRPSALRSAGTERRAVPSSTANSMTCGVVAGRDLAVGEDDEHHGDGG